MSSTIDKLYTKKYSSFGQAVSNYLEYKELEQTWLVEKIIEKDQKFRSLQQMVSRWLGGATISRHYRNKINAVLDINVYKDQEGFWRISRTNNETTHSDEPRVQYADSVELPESGKLSKDQMRKLLGQIELIARILKDSLQ